jgi:hypothetical protein
MPRKEHWFNCPMCGRPVRVTSEFAEKDFVHPLCGSTLRASIPSEGEPDIELISTPEIKETARVDLEAIKKSASHGLFVPRHLRKNSPSWTGKTAEQSKDEGLVEGESPGAISARSARVLSTPAGGTGEREQKLQSTKDKTNADNLRAQFSRTLDDLNPDTGNAGESGSSGESTGEFQQQRNEQVVASEKGKQSNSAVREMTGRKKFVTAAFTAMILVAVILMGIKLLRGD